MTSAFKLSLLIGALLGVAQPAALAENCSSNESIRLDQTGSSLAKASVQDQDGMGTCYANAASVMLQSVTPNNPDLSFMQMSVNHLDSLNKERTDGVRSYNVDGGFICRAFNSTIERQNNGLGLCPRAKVPLENSKNIEGPYLSTVSFLESINKKKTTESQAEATKGREFFKTIAKNLQTEIAQGAQQRCTPPQYKLDLTKLNTVGVIEDILINALEENQSCVVRGLPVPQPDLCAGLLNSYAASTHAQTKSFASFQSVTFKYEFRDKILNKIEKEKNNLKSANDLMKLIEKELAKLLFSNSKKNKRAVAILNQNTDLIRDRLLPQLQDDLNLLKGQADEACRVQYAIEVLTKKPEALLPSSCPECAGKEAAATVNAVGNIVSKFQFKNLNQIYDLLNMNASKELTPQIMGILAGNCGPNDWVKAPANASCKDSSPDFTPGDFNTMGPKYNEFVKATRDKIANSLKRGAAVGYSLCTRFLKDENFTYHAVEPVTQASAKCQEERHGFHAVALVGYRCENGKAQYLLQNSWGTKWQPERKDLHAENGKIWLDEKDLFGNGVDFGFVEGVK